MEDEEDGETKIKSALMPYAPSRKEVEAHNATHLPYRSWCPHCVRGRGVSMHHAKASEDEVEKMNR
eukprot:10089624-Karenia_brevis.AAC.1